MVLLSVLTTVFTFLLVSTQQTTEQFLLITRVLPNQTRQEFNNLYLNPFHTAAGYNVATFDKHVTESPPAILNGARLQFDFGHGQYPAYMRLDSPVSDFYAGWFTTNIDQVDDGSYGFQFDSDGLLTYRNGTQLPWVGWRLCIWNHGEPELFHDIAGGFNAHVPSNCARVDLIKAPYPPSTSATSSTTSSATA